MTNTQSLEKLAEEIDLFVTERDWKQFHTPKNLAMALSVEVSELVEIFQWLTPQESFSRDAVDIEHLEEEIGDIMVYLSYISSAFAINPVEAALKKIEKNKTKYPPEKFRGRAKQP